MEKLNNKKKIEFFKWMVPILNSLKKLGGSGTPEEVIELIANEYNIPETKRKERLKISGKLKFANEIVWAGWSLIWEEFVNFSPGDIWRLTERGNRTELTEEQAREIFFKWLDIIVKEQKQMNLTENTKADQNIRNEVSVTEHHKKALLNLLARLPPEGFEKLCLRLLYESGFSKVTAASVPGEKGIEGIGILQLNPFVSFKVLFQCKQGKEMVARAQIGDLRNAMIGRADKGIIITIGEFTPDAVKEADRDGAPPIELVDGKKLVEMFEKIQLGLIPKTIYEIDPSFFQPFFNPNAS